MLRYKTELNISNEIAKEFYQNELQEMYNYAFCASDRKSLDGVIAEVQKYQATLNEWMV